MPDRLPRSAAASASGVEPPSQRRRIKGTEAGGDEAAEAEDSGVPKKRGKKRQEAEPAPKARPKIRDMKLGRDHQTLMTVMTKQVLASALACRETVAATCDTYLLQTTMPEVVAIKEEGKRYAEVVQAEGRGHRRGPPGPHMLLGLLTSLLVRKESVGLRTYGYLQKFNEGLAEAEIMDLSLFVKICRLQKTYDSDKVRLVLSLQDSVVPGIVSQEVREAMQKDWPELCPRLALRRALTEAGAKHLAGRAPPGAMESILQDALGGVE